MRALRYSRVAAKALARLDRPARDRMEQAILDIADNPLVGKKLKGDFARERLRSLKVWPYRVVYRFDPHHIDIVFIEHRKGVYR